MAITINGVGTIGGITAGGLPDACVTAADLAVGAARTNFGAGAVLQVVQGILTEPVVYAGPAWGAIGLSMMITPTSATSKILIRVTIQVGGDSSSNDNGLSLVRNGTHIALPTNYGSRMGCFMPLNQRNQSQHETATVSGEFLDNPLSTAALTYSIMACSINSQPQYINRTSWDANDYADSRHISTITLMEIAA